MKYPAEIYASIWVPKTVQNNRVRRTHDGKYKNITLVTKTWVCFPKASSLIEMNKYVIKFKKKQKSEVKGKQSKKTKWNVEMSMLTVCASSSSSSPFSTSTWVLVTLLLATSCRTISQPTWFKTDTPHCHTQVQPKENSWDQHKTWLP